MDRKQIKTICIYTEVPGSVNNQVPIRFSRNIHVPFQVNYIESTVEFATGDTADNAAYTNGCLHSNLIPNSNLSVASSIGFTSKHSLRDMSFNGLYNFEMLGPDGNLLYLPLSNPATNAYVLLQITFYE